MFWMQMINGLTLGVSYSLVALGYTLVFGVLNVVNMAHGDILMMVTFFVAFGILHWKWGLFMGLFVAIFGAALLGILVERLCINTLKGRDFFSPLITTIGASIFLQSLAVRIFGGERHPFPQVLQIKHLKLGIVTVTNIQLVIIIISIVVMVGLILYINRTKMGFAIRAVAENPDIASFLGVNTNLVKLSTFAIASALGGLAGMLLGISFGTITPFMGLQFGLKGLIVLIIGGVGNIFGAMVGGIMLGLLEVLTTAYITSSYRDAIAFGMLIIVLLVRPEGLLGERGRVKTR